MINFLLGMTLVWCIGVLVTFVWLYRGEQQELKSYGTCLNGMDPSVLSLLALSWPLLAMALAKEVKPSLRRRWRLWRGQSHDSVFTVVGTNAVGLSEVRERCYVCDFPLATDADHDADPQHSREKLCWSAVELSSWDDADEHSGPRIDWRQRARAAEQRIEVLNTLYAAAMASRDALRSECDALKKGDKTVGEPTTQATHLQRLPQPGEYNARVKVSIEGAVLNIEVLEFIKS